MKAGKELDALVAEKVMGYVREFHEQFKLDGWRTGEHSWTNSFSPTKDIADAWKVVDKFGGFVHLITEEYHEKICWHCVFNTNDWVKAETAPLAICIASLKTKGIDIDG